MADPRKTVDHNEIKPINLTFAIDNSTITYSATVAGGSSQVGQAVKLSAADTIALVGNADHVLGKLILVHKDNYATVQVGGVVTLASGSGGPTLTVGSKVVGATGGGIRSATASTAAEVAVARGMILDAGATGAVEILL